MNDARRFCLLCCAAAARGVIGAGEAARILEAHREWLTPGATGPRPGPEALGDGWRGLAEEKRAAFLAEVASLEKDEARAEAVVRAAALPDGLLRAWWDGSSGGDVKIDLDFAIGEIAAEDLPRQRTLPRMAPEERYEVKNEVARGGMGRVLLARDALLGRRVAVKEMLAGAVEDGASSRDVERFLREARVTSQLEHPNIVPVHEVGQRADGTLFYTMKLVKGETMAKRLEAASREGTEAGRYRARMKLLDAFVDVCQAMAYAHSRGVVNRDLKPSNVMLGDFGETVVLDWGLARVRGQEDAARKDVERRTLSLVKEDDTSKLTMDGTILGTPSYMSPEQARGEIDVVDEKSDVWSLGAILYEIVTGVPPFLGETAEATVRAVVAKETTAPSAVEPRAPAELEALILKALAKEREARLPSAKLFADEVLAFRDGRALSTFTYTGMQQVKRLVRRHPGVSFGLAAAAAALLAGSAISTYWGLRSRQDSQSARTSEERARVEAGRATDRARDAEDAARRAEGLRLAAKAQVLRDSNPGQAIWLAVRAAERAPGAEANSALYATLARLSEKSRMYGSFGFVGWASFSPDGARVVSTGSDGAVRLWDAATGAPLRVLVGHWGQVLSAEFSPDGAKLLSAGQDGRVVLWDTATGQAIATFRGNGKSPGFAWSPSSRFLATWGDGNGIRIWTDAGLPVATVEGAAPYAAFAADGKRFAVPHAGAVDVYDTAGTLLRSLAHPSSPSGAAWTPDGRAVVTTDGLGTLRSWNVDTGTAILEQTVMPGARLGRPVVSPDGTRAAFHAKGASGALELVVVGLADGRTLAHFAHVDLLRPASFAPDWSSVLRIREADIEIVAIPSGETTGTLTGHINRVLSAEFSADGRQVASASADWSAVAWNVAPGGEMRTWPGAGPSGVCDDTDVEASTVLASVGDRRALDLVDFRTGAKVRTLLPSGSSEAHGLFLQDRRIVAWRAEPASIEILDAAGSRPPVALPCAAAPILRVVACGPWIAARFGPGGSGVFRVWDSRTGRLTGEIPCAVETNGFTVSPDGASLIAGNQSTVLDDFDVASGKLRTHVIGHVASVNDTVWIPGPSRLLTSAYDGLTRVLDVDSNTVIAVLRWPKGEPTRIAASGSGRLAWIYSRSEARLFDLASGQPIARVEESLSIESVSWARDGHTAAFQLGNGRVRLVPVDVLPVARAALPREPSPLEMAELDVGTPAEREAMTRDWLERHPNAFAFYDMAEGYLFNGLFREAAEAYRASLGIYSNLVQPHFGLARALLGLGDRKGALAELRAALALGLSPEILDAPDSGFEELRSEPGWAETAATRPPP